MVHVAAPSEEPRAAPPAQIEHLETFRVARAAGLHYVNDAMPGIRRRRAGRGLSYIGPDGKPIHDQEELARIRALGIPPAWTDVWISPSATGHIQATGRDARGRKQYRYHPHWREVRDASKYDHLLAFAEALPAIRSRVDQDLRRPGLSREKVLATVVALLGITLIRVGNDEYARQNRSYGLTTLHNRHVDVDGSRLRFHFRGKSGKEHRIGVRDRRLARIIRRCQELPGHELFEYRDEDGELRRVVSEDVNAYLREISGLDITAKDFRTWGGTVAAAWALAEQGGFESETEAKHRIAQAIKTAAQHLGNTPAICRKCYVHPGVVEAYRDGALLAGLGRRTPDAAAEFSTGLHPEEAAVLELLRQPRCVITAPDRSEDSGT
jgi:DNA topoisomerase-1